MIILPLLVRKESNELMKKLSNEGVSEDAIKDGENEIQRITEHLF